MKDCKISVKLIRFLELRSYSGILQYNVGGGRDHYNYITVKNGKLVKEELWKYNYSKLEFLPETEKFTQDEALIEQSKQAMEQNRDIKFLSLKDLGGSQASVNKE